MSLKTYNREAKVRSFLNAFVFQNSTLKINDTKKSYAAKSVGHLYSNVIPFPNAQFNRLFQVPKYWNSFVVLIKVFHLDWEIDRDYVVHLNVKFLWKIKQRPLIGMKLGQAR